MTDTLQPVLCNGHGVTTDISVFSSQAGKTYDTFMGLALLERVSADPDNIQQKMLLGRLCNAGFRLNTLSSAFNREPRSIKKWAKAMQSGDVDEMSRAFAGRGKNRKVTPELVRYVQQLYRDRDFLGRNYRQQIRQKVKEVFGVTVSTTTISAICCEERQRSEASCHDQNRAITLQNEENLSSDSPSSVKLSPVPLPVQQTTTAEKWEQLIHHAGQAIFAYEMRNISDSFSRQMVGQILQGAVNVEQSKTLCRESLSHFTGPVIGGLRDQRVMIGSMADADTVVNVYRTNATLLVDGPNRGNQYYFDPHTKKYTGKLKTLKGWCGGTHAITKIVNMDSFHTRSGRPCFVQHYSPYYDMRERFFMSLTLFDRLFDEDKRQGRTFVIDRGIYGLATLMAFTKDYIITWEKGFKGNAWDERKSVITFTRSLTKNSKADQQQIQFNCQVSAWSKAPSFRRIIVRATSETRSTIEVSVITSNPYMDIQDVVWAIFRRWLQENDFKYLDVYFGFNQLTSRDYSTFAREADHYEDRPMESPEYKELKSNLQGLEARLGRQLVNQRKHAGRNKALELEQAKLDAYGKKLENELEATLECLKNGKKEPAGSKDIQKRVAGHKKQMKALKEKRKTNLEKQEKIQEAIEAVENEIEPLESTLCEAIRKQSRLSLLINGDYCLLDTRKKAVMDAFRVMASNIFRNVQERFRVIYNNFRDDHAMVRVISRSSGTVRIKPDSVIFTIWLPGSLQPYRLRHIETLLAEIQRSINNEIPARRSVILKLKTGPQSI